LGALECHAKDNTFSVYGNVGQIGGRHKKYNKQILPFLQHYFTNEVIPLAGARPTQFTHDTVLERIEVRDSRNVLGLDLSDSKHRLYRMYASLHGWKMSLYQKETLFVVIVWMTGRVERKGIYMLLEIISEFLVKGISTLDRLTAYARHL